MKRQSTTEKFWAKVRRDRHWRWVGAVGTTGYGNFRVGDSHELAHRVAWRLRGNPPVRRLRKITSRCDDVLCVRPSHWRSDEGVTGKD